MTTLVRQRSFQGSQKFHTQGANRVPAHPATHSQKKRGRASDMHL